MRDVFFSIKIWRCRKGPRDEDAIRWYQWIWFGPIVLWFGIAAGLKKLSEKFWSGFSKNYFGS